MSTDDSSAKASYEDFYTLSEYKPPGWTGYCHGVKETFGKTPACAQLSAKQPRRGDFLHTVRLPPAGDPAKDICNHSQDETMLGRKSGKQPNLWPPLQSSGRAESFKPLGRSIELGDARIKQFSSTYAQTFVSPLPGGEELRSPLHNKVLGSAVDLRDEYQFALQRVGEKRLKEIISHMRERFHGRIGNKSDNAFKLRKFAKMYDMDHTGMISLEDFRVMTEANGIQLDDDSLLSLFSQYDKDAVGKVQYAQIMKDVLDQDALALFLGESKCMIDSFSRCLANHT